MKNNILNKITQYYLMVMIIIFPLIVGPKGYENILEIKYYFFMVLSTTYFLLSTIIYFYFLIIKNNNLLKNKKMLVLDYLVLLYLLVNILSVAFSPYKSFNLMKGLGRGEGLFITIIYTLNYFFITKLGKLDKKIFIYFSISSILVSLIGCLQFWGLNPLDLYKGISGPYNMSFMSTIGNIDFLSAYYTITISIASLCYIFKDNFRKENIIYLFSLIISIFIFLLINVDSGKVVFLFLIMLLLPSIIKNNQRLRKFFHILAIVIFGYFLNYFVDMRYFSNNIYKASWHINHISLLLFITIIILLIASYLLNKKTYNIKNTNNLYYAYIPLGIMSLIILYNYNFGISFLEDFQSILHGNFDDTIGNYRLFLWKRSLLLFKDYPLLGTGPDTFAMRFMTNFKDDILLIGEMSINDTAANVYLTNLVNIGALGLISYLLIIIDPFLKKNKGLHYKILLLTLMCYNVQAFFNLSLVIITPFLWIILGLLNIEKDTIK